MRIKGLDGLRAIAFLLVFFFHTNQLPFGWVGVQLFYVLSGFLITGILSEMKAAMSGWSYFIKFYGRRFLRIFPLYYFYLIVIWLVVALMDSQQYKRETVEIFQHQFPYAVGYLYNFFVPTKFFVGTSVFLDHFWSLAVEEQFYIVWPILILLTPQKRQKTLFVGVILFSIAFRLAALVLVTAHTPPFLRPDPNLVIYFLPFSHLDAFALGALLTIIKLPFARQQFGVLLVLLPIIGIASALIASTETLNIWSLGYTLLLSDSYKAVWAYTAINYLFALLIQLVAEEGLYYRFLESEAMKYLGKISYGLYIYHFAIIWFLSVPFGISNLLPLPFTVTVSALGLTILAASLSYRWLEKPLIDLKDKFFALPTSGEN